MTSLAVNSGFNWNRIKLLPIALGLMSLSLISPALAQEKVLRTLTVTGRGVEEIATTITQVRLGVDAQGKTANEVQEAVAQRSNAVVTLLKSRSVEKLETTGINLNPVYSYDNNRQKLEGYGASNTVSFQVPTERAGTLLDEAVKAGASRIDGVSFVSSDAAIAAAQKLALRRATQDAQSQANEVFDTLNLTRKEIVSIQVNGASAPIPLMADVARLKVAASQAPTPVIGGEQRVEGSVTLQISY